MFPRDLRIVLRGLGLLVPMVGLMAALSVPVALWFGEHFALWPLGLTVGVAMGLGLLLYLPFRRAGEAQLKHALLIAALGWLLIAVVGALPFWLMSVLQAGGEALPYADFSAAFFESVSGYTSTGLTMAERPDLLPRTLQWWRSFTEWIGGMGVIVLMLTVMAGPGRTTMSLYLAEARTEKIHPSVVSTVRTMWWIFVVLTGGAVVAFWAGGMPLWEAVNHGMTGLATGGFTLWPESIGHYNSVGLELVVMLVMIAGSVSFVVHHRAVQRGPRHYLRDIQTRWFLGFLVGGSVLVALQALAQLMPGQAFRHGFFQYVSAMTCTGFATSPVVAWSDAAKLMLSFGMIVGGAAGSTTGGIKVMRFLLLLRGVGWHLRKAVKPADALVPFRLGGHVFAEGEAYRRLEEASTITFLWLGFFLAAVLALAQFVPPEHGLADVLFEVASAQGNVGLSVGITNPAMPTPAKLILSFSMWVGRLEIIPVLMLVRSLVRGMR